jgi:hypothetical protein
MDDYKEEYTEEIIFRKMEEIKKLGMPDTMRDGDILMRLKDMVYWQSRLLALLFKRDRMRTDEVINKSITMEKKTNRLIKLTWGLLLFAVISIAVVSYQNRKAEINNNKIQTITNSKIDSLISAVKNMPFKENQPNKDKSKQK